MKQGHRARSAAILFAAAMAIPSFTWAAPPQVPGLPSATAGYVQYAITDAPNYYKTLPVSATNNTPASNPITDAGATLGRVLFYDKRLSHNNGVSCSSCHKQAKGFSDENQFSAGIDGQLTGRHAPGLSNVTFYASGKAFWDERAASIEDQALMPIQSATEMGSTLSEVVAKLSATTYYPTLFNAAFGDSAINSERIGKAIAQFERSMVSYNSKFDAQLKAPTESILNTDELAGQALFNRRARCASSHATNARVSDTTHNVGLDATITDPGVNKDGKFKAPSLRNVEVRGRFMHDGRFSSLEEVIQFYSTGVQDSDFLDARLKTPLQLNLTSTEVADVVAYLKTFTDTTFLSSPLFSDPFVTLPGDYDGDGIVGPADYIIWRKSVGDTTSLVADGNGDHIVNYADCDVWRQNFGKTGQVLTYGASGGLANVPVPEPAGFALALIVLICGLVFRARRSG